MAKMSAKTRHLRRIRQQIRRMEKRGYTFDEEFKAGLKERSARSLAQLKTEGLYKRSKLKIPDIETGEIKTVKGTEGRKFERSQAAQKSARTRKVRRALYEEDIPDISDEVVDNLNALLFKLGQPVSQMAVAKDGHIFPKSNALISYSQGAKNSLQQMLENEVARTGTETVAKRIYYAGETIDEILGVIEYSAYIEEIQKAVHTFAGIIKGRIYDETENINKDDFNVDDLEFYEEEFEGWPE